MSPLTVIILAALAAVFVLLAVLLILRRRDTQFMAKNRHTVPGTVTEVHTVRTGDNAAERVKIRYTVNEKDYTHICYTRPQKYCCDQTVSMIVHPDKPRLAFPESQFRPMPAKDVQILAVFLVLLYVFTACMVLSYTNGWQSKLDHFEMPIMLLSSWFSYLDEYRIVRRGASCKGTIVYTERDHKTVRVIAEFTVGGVTYETRMMNLPVKRCKREYNQGGQIGVLYREQNPAEAVVEDDTLNEKAKRTAVIVCSIVLPVFWVICVFLIP